mgnify:CR=1 FL=1
MTWKEFRDHVEAELAAQGCDGTAEVEYIDVSHPDNAHPSTEVEVRCTDGKIAVQN